MSNYYKVTVDNTRCTKCGACSAIGNSIFAENDNKIVVKKNILDEQVYSIVKEIKSYCLSDAITITKLEDKSTNKDKLVAEIKTLSNLKLSKIKIPSLKKSDYMLYSDDIKISVNFFDIYSPYKYRTSEDAESSGTIKLQNIISENEKIILKSALIDYQVKKINRFINREDYNYFFKNVEDEFNNIVNQISEDLDLLGLKIQLDYFKPNLKDLYLYSYLETFSDYDDFSTYFHSCVTYDYYVDYDWLGEKYRYIIKSEKIEEYFKDMVYGVFSEHIEKVFERNINDFIKSYNEVLIAKTNEVKTLLFSELQYTRMYGNSSVKNTNYKDNIKSILNDFEKIEDDCLVASKGYISMSSRDCDYIYKSFNSAYNAGDSRLKSISNDMKNEFRNYTDKLSNSYSELLIEQIENLLLEIQNVYVINNLSLDDKVISIPLDLVPKTKFQSLYKFYLNESKICKESREGLERIISNTMRDEVDSIIRYSDLSCTCFDVDSLETYIGDSIFGNMKFADRYCYKFNRTKINEEIDKTYKLINEKCFNLDILKKYRKLFKEEIEKELL